MTLNQCSLLFFCFFAIKSSNSSNADSWSNWLVALQSTLSVTVARCLSLRSKLPSLFVTYVTRTHTRIHVYRTCPARPDGRDANRITQCCRRTTRHTSSDKFNFSPPVAAALSRRLRRPFLWHCRRAVARNDFSLVRQGGGRQRWLWAACRRSRSNREVAKWRLSVDGSRAAGTRGRCRRRLRGPIKRYDGAVRPCCSNHSLKLCAM